MQKEIIKKIKEKKPLNRLDDEFVKYFIDYILERNFKIKKKFEKNSLKKSEIDFIVKNVRNILNKIYGQFWVGDELEIESHKSTNERKDYYQTLYKKIFEITGNPKRILDLASGLNPLSYNLIKNCHFISSELTEYDCNKLKKYFKENNINGEVIKTNLFFDKEFPEADICFLFKILESIDLKGHKNSEGLIKNINAKWIVISFSKIAANNKKMNYPRRGWLEIMLKRLNLEFKKIDFENEVFYIVKKF